MAIGDVVRARAVHDDCWYVDTGMYDVEEYGSVYLVDGDRPALVDTGLGTNVERVLDLLDAADLAPEALDVIALTHVHLDHAGGAGPLVEACPNATVFVHESGARHLVDPARLWAGTKQAVGDQIEYYTEPTPIPESRIETLTDGDVIDLGDYRLRARHAPGHAPHQVVFDAPELDAVFTADAAGIYTPSTDEVHVTSPPPNFDLDGALDDVAMLADLDRTWLCYAHYGPARTDDRLDEYATTLETWVEAVETARADADDEAVVDHFVETVETPAVWSDHKARAEVAMNVRGVLTYLDRREESAESTDSGRGDTADE
ncbi:MBL fold metallo-hydrolase [Halomicrobium mukohataei]|uniref:MBL fold metallo-hydrolase n=1 Tax=Halomicrobium mukohataei TaxID=57705 RepID=A0A847U9M2_9EURY|nr:MBL fold metallo-hydrolase [Halomicrobium mukohataei]NLV09226.1 MBL fold metallo-hydrolase [Halomicrobium mukohataei]